MENRNWDHIVWIALKVIFWLFVASAIIMIIGAIFNGIGNCLEENPWVGWILSIAFWVGVVWHNIKKDS